MDANLTSERAKELFQYLCKVAELRLKAVYSLDEYESVVLISSIPKESECFTPAWGEVKSGQEEIWIGVKKVNFIDPPPVSHKLKSWVNETDLQQSSDIPQIKESIGIASDTGTNTLKIEDCPEISDLWEDYLGERWLPWAEENERLCTIQRVYSKLHSMYQMLKSLGEAFELVMGFGVLTWKTPSGNRVQRPLITAQACIELDTKRGNLFVKQSPDGAKLSIEDDMLDVSERCRADVYNSIRSQLNSIGDDVWDKTEIESFLKTWLYSVSSKGLYDSNLEKATEFKEDPKISYAPVLILRRRTSRIITDTLKKITEQVENTGSNEIPANIRKCITISDESERETKGVCTGSDEVYFPLPTNNEQIRIVDRLRAQDGVVVQGPPGTGKSHTIANLICHLLAEGKRVLVTSQTQRALKVLKEKLPPEVAPLCVNLLGHDNDSLNQLKTSVEAIRNQKVNFDKDEYKRKIKGTREEIQDLRERRAALQHRLIECRERETYEHRICDGKYSGTAQVIAQQIANQADLYNWLDVSIPENATVPLNNTQLTEFIKLCKILTAEQIKATELLLIDISELPTPEQFQTLQCAETMATDLFQKHEEWSKTVFFSTLASVTKDRRDKIKETISKLIEVHTSISQKDCPWMHNVAMDIFSERDKKWKHLHQITQNSLKQIEPELELIENAVVNVPVQDSTVIMADAEQLINHLKSGGRFGIPGLRPAVVKKTWYLIKSSHFNGNPCNCVMVLEKLHAKLRLEKLLEDLHKQWVPYTSVKNSTRTGLFHDISDACSALEKLLQIKNLVEEAKQEHSQFGNSLQVPAWHSISELQAFVKAIDAAEAYCELAQIKRKFLSFHGILTKRILGTNAHPVLKQLLNATDARDSSKYTYSYEFLKQLIEIKERVGRYFAASKALEVTASELLSAITSNPQSNLWNKATDFSSAWLWAKAKTWMQTFIATHNEIDINIELKSVEGRIGTQTAELASLLAWDNCLSRLTESERFHLMSWADEMKKVGKGTGKYAELHRSNARTHMEQCRSAIPAWIMPLFRVFETVQPVANAYDIVIIDEASQSSATDAFFLMYIAKKIIVVGDPEQISPLSINIELSQIESLKEQFISDIPIRNALGPNNSFFDLANILFASRVDLREHFRCMPEIIEFSNRLCYTTSPLIPLKLYPPKRLEPVKTWFVETGYREGSKNARNVPEAEALCQKIKECCQNPDYNGKTMGVISLLGDHQAKIISDRLLSLVGSTEIEKRNLVCGDAYAFQGDERDVMFLSMVAAPNETTMTALVTEPMKQRFNVAASRAKEQMWLFHSAKLNDFRNHECLRYKLLEYCTSPLRFRTEINGLNIAKLKSDSLNSNRAKFGRPGSFDNSYTDFFDSWFEVDVFLQMAERGYRVIPQFEVAKYYIDFAVEGERGRLAVECDGDYHDEPEQKERDLNRQRILERCGCVFLRIKGSEFYLDQRKSLEPLWLKLNELGILPGGKDKVAETAVPENSNEEVSTSEALFESSYGHADVRSNGKLDFSPVELGNSVVAILKSCPNNSCTKKSITSRVCRYLQVVTRGKRREDFEKRILKALKELKDKGVVEEYIATNVRIRLVQHRW